MISTERSNSKWEKTFYELTLCCCVTQYYIKKDWIYLFDGWFFIAKMSGTIMSCEVGQIYGVPIIEYVTKSFFFSGKHSWENVGSGHWHAANVGAMNWVSFVIYKNKRCSLFIVMQYWGMEIQTEALVSGLFPHDKVMQCNRGWTADSDSAEDATSILHILGVFHHGLHLADTLWTNTLAAGAHKGCCWKTSSGFILLESNQHCPSQTAPWCKPKGIQWESLKTQCRGGLMWMKMQTRLII